MTLSWSHIGNVCVLICDTVRPILMYYCRLALKQLSIKKLLYEERLLTYPKNISVDKLGEEIRKEVVIASTTASRFRNDYNSINGKSATASWNTDRWLQAKFEEIEALQKLGINWNFCNRQIVQTCYQQKCSKQNKHKSSKNLDAIVPFKCCCAI